MMKTLYNDQGHKMCRIPCFRLPIFLLALSYTALAQICDVRSGSPMQMKIQLTFDDKTQDAAPGAVASQNDPIHRGDSAGNVRSYDFTALQIRVQLQDPTGGTFQEQMPASDGEVRMTVCKKAIYRLQITGADIEEAIVDSVQPGHGDSLVTVVLHRKLTKEERKVQKATISAHGLRIPRKAQKQLEKGDEAFKRGKITDAEKYYSKAAQIYPQFEQAENSLGIVFMQEGDGVDGKAAFARAIAINPNYAPAQVNLAKIAFDEKRYNDSYVLARQALKSEPLNTAALFVAAESSFFKQVYRETVNYARTLHSLPHQQYGLAHYLAAKSLEALQQPDAAIEEYRTFLEEAPDDPNAKRARELIRLLQATAGPAPSPR
jgi:Flp pilus assembly protein TadD